MQQSSITFVGTTLDGSPVYADPLATGQHIYVGHKSTPNVQANTSTQQGLLGKMVQAGNQIARKGSRGCANFVVTSPEMAEFLTNLDKTVIVKKLVVKGNENVCDSGWHYKRIVGGKLIVYVPNAIADEWHDIETMHL